MKELQFILTDSSGVAVTLPNSPDGWDESMIVTERSRKYHGIFRSFTIPLKFIKEGATIIRNEFYTNGLLASCSIQVQKLNKYTLTYFTAYTGKIDFATFKDHDYTVEVTSVDGGLAQIIKNMESEEVMFVDTDFGEMYGVSEARVVNAVPNHSLYVMKFIQVFSAIVDKITDGAITLGTYAVKSDFLLSDTIFNKYYLATVGGIKYPDRPYGQINYQSTLADFFQSCNSLWCMGMGIELIEGVETLVLEPREHFYNTDLIHNVGNSENLTLGYVSEFKISKVKSGYPNFEYNDEANVGNGPANVAEPNTETNYLISKDISKNEYDIISKYRADSVGLTLMWGSETENTEDNDLCILVMFEYTYESTPGNFVTILTHTFGALSKKNNLGVDYSYPWNVEISPKRNLLRHKRFLNGCCYRMSGHTIDFISGTNDQFYNLTAVLPSVLSTVRDWIEEYEGFEIDDTDTWFRPIEFNIDAAYPSDLVNKIAANPYGVIGFTYEGKEYTGYILKMETKLSGAGSVKYSLLSTADNDLTKLIR